MSPRPPTDTSTSPSSTSNPPNTAQAAVLKPSDPVPEGSRTVHGIEFNNYKDAPITVEEMVTGMSNMGFQASAVADAVRVVDDMRTWHDPETNAKTTIFLGYTSNLISSGLRETIRYLVQHKHVSAIVTTAGGIEEDLIKCLGKTYLGSFNMPGATLREQGMNRIGNLIVPNNNYCAFEDWVIPILDRLLAEQEASADKNNSSNTTSLSAATNGTGTIETEGLFNWTPSRLIHRLGLEINDERSVCYWAAKNSIPIFCPALTDGSLGDMLYFHSFKAAEPGRHLRLDIVEDLRRINLLSVHAKRVGMIVLGGGLVKHHIANACLMRNGAERAVFVNTGQEFDGSDAGARPDEAVSWGKIKADAESVKVYADATVVFPLIVAATFAKVSGKP